MRISMILIGTMALTACGISVPDSLSLADMTEEQATALCEELASDDPREVTCDFGSGVSATITIGLDAADCDDIVDGGGTDSTLTAGELRDCLSALDSVPDEDFCDPKGDGGFPAECDAVFGGTTSKAG